MMEIIQADIIVVSRYWVLAISERRLAALLPITFSTTGQKDRYCAARSDDKSEYADDHVHIIFPL